MPIHLSSRTRLPHRHYTLHVFLFPVLMLHSQMCHAQYSDACRSINGKLGTCVPLAYCPLFSSWLKMRPVVKENLRLLVKYTCYFDTRHPRACCPNDDLFPEPDESIIIGIRVGVPRRHGSDSDHVPNNKLSFPGSSLQFPTPSPPTSESRDVDLSAPAKEHEQQREHVPLSFPTDKQERGKSIWDIPKVNKDPSLHLKDYRHHPNFNLIPSLQECSNAVKLDSLNGAYGAFPWISLIGLKTRKHTFEFEHFCAGSVINERYILTAAHCFKHVTPNFVRLGEYNLGSLIDQGSDFLPQSRWQDFRIEKTTVHRAYDPLTTMNDIALIRVDRKIPLNTTFIKAICLPFIAEYELETSDLSHAKELDGKPGWIAGWSRHSWGNTYSSGSDSKILQEGIVDFAPFNNCHHDYSQLSALNARTQLCVGGKDRRNSCVSDSGGPLMVPVKVPSRIPGFKEPKFFLLGLLSQGPTGSECQKIPKNPSDESELRSVLPSSVFTRVSKYLSWILDNMQDSK